MPSEWNQRRGRFTLEGRGRRTCPRCNPISLPGERSTYFPIIYTGPLEEANQSRLNYDFYADAAHREVMDLARDTGEPQATRKVFVLTEAPPNSGADLALQPGFVVYLPIYQEGESLGTVVERRRALQGFVVGSFISDKLLNGIFEGSFDPAIDFEVYDGANVRSSLLLYDSDGIKRAGERGDDPLFAKNDRIETAGREWSLYFASLPRFEKGTESNVPLFVLASGTTVSLLLFGITSMLVRSRTLAEHASKDLEEANKELEAYSSEAETRYRTLVEQTPAITYVQEPLESSNPKAVTYVSPQYETILGYPPESKIIDEEHWLSTVHPEDRERVLAEEARTDQTGEPFRVEYRVIAGMGGWCGCAMRRRWCAMRKGNPCTGWVSSTMSPSISVRRRRGNASSRNSESLASSSRPSCPRRCLSFPATT